MEHRLHQRVPVRIAAEIVFKGVRTDNLYTRDISGAGVFIETEASALPLLSLVQVRLNDVANGVQVNPMDMLVVHKSDTGVGLMSIRQETAITAIVNIPRAHLPVRAHHARYAHRR
ncbi:MAG: PilZ domain-containing protein [Halioglobus sp.]|nr:PilZ domain-containing protein [Halioglobus sp.]